MIKLLFRIAVGLAVEEFSGKRKSRENRPRVIWGESKEDYRWWPDTPREEIDRQWGYMLEALRWHDARPPVRLSERERRSR